MWVRALIVNSDDFSIADRYTSVFSESDKSNESQMFVAAISGLLEKTNNFVSSCRMMQLPYLVLLQAPRNNFL